MAIAIKILEQSVVVFSKNYLPLSRVNIKRALTIASESRIWKVPPVNRREVLRLCTKPKAPVHPGVAFAEQFWREQQVHLEQEESSGQC